MPITGPREATSTDRPTATAVLSAPVTRTPAVPATTAPAPGAASEPARATDAAPVNAAVSPTIDSTTTKAATAREANSAVRERPVAARSRKTPDSRSWVPAVPPTMAPTTKAIAPANEMMFR